MAAAILTLRRGTTPSNTISEPYFNTSLNTLQVGIGGDYITLVKLGSNTGNITLTGNLSINGGISGSTLDITGDAKIGGNIEIGGNIVLGTGSNDIIIVNAPFTGSIIPQEDGQDDLGSPVKRFRELHVVSASIDNISVPGSGILSSSNETFSDFSQSVDFRLDTEEGKSSTLANYTSSVDNRLNNLELDSASQDARLDNLELFTSSQEDLNQTFATTGSNIFIGDQTISGSLDVSGTIKSQVYLNPKTLNGFTVPDGYNAMLVGPVDINGDITLEGDSNLLILDKITLPDGLLSSSVTDFDTFSASIDYRLDSSDQNFTDFSQSVDSRLDLLELNSSSLDGLYEEKASGTHTLISGSDQLTGSLVDLVSNQTINGTKTFNDIVVNGTGSFAYITSVSGTAKIIGDAFIVVNTNTPTARYAGLSVYDSGSTASTASFYYDGETNDWGYEYSSSASVDYAVALFGPEYTTKGNPTYLTINSIPKAVDNHHLNDSNISDSGTLITLNSNSQVNGNLVVTGTVSANNLISGSSQISYPNLSNIPAGIVSGSSQVSYLGLSNIPAGIISSSSQITTLLPSGVVSGSSQINLTQTTNYESGIRTRLNAEGVVSGSTQITKSLQDVTSIGSTTSNAITITNNTTSTDKISGALVVTGGIGTSGDIFAGGDVVAYASSDIRLKNNLELISNPLQKINQIGGYSFEWNVEKQDIYKGKDYGVIAQEIEQILPELVDTRENGYKAVKYDKLVSLLIEGIKDLSKQVDELKEKINKG